MNNPSEKQLLNRLLEILDNLGVKNETVLTTVINPVTKVQHTELRNQHKKMIKAFKSFDYNRKVHELIALEARLDYDSLNKEAKENDSVVSSNT